MHLRIPPGLLPENGHCPSRSCAKPCSPRRYSCDSSSSSSRHRRRPAQAQHKGERSCACPCRRVPTRHRAGSPCPGSRGRVLRPCGHRAGQTSPLMICWHRSRACRRIDGSGRGFRCDARRARSGSIEFRLHAVGAVGAGQLVPVTFEEEMQAFIYFSCIGYECQTFHPKMGMLRRHTHFVVVPG